MRLVHITANPHVSRGLVNEVKEEMGANHFGVEVGDGAFHPGGAVGGPLFKRVG